MALIAGLAGSFVGGLLAASSSVTGSKIRPSGIIGSFIGAVIITAIWQREPPASADADPPR